jgi:demethylmenaquinone methyltransferase/2-methoxy-6-polyprenyl-1,4-benzoquinol methylase
MFDRIAHRYDLLNRLLSFRQDIAWRKALCSRLPNRPNQHVLDLATGTADVLLALHHQSDKVASGVGLDMSTGMLELGKRKIEQHGLSSQLSLVLGDAASIAVSDNTFDAATIAFGIRNVADVDAALGEIHRVLKPGGRLLILEFSIPRNAAIRGLYLFYFRHVLPSLGGFISGDRSAYRYLNESVEAFPYGEAFVQLMRRAGFSSVESTPLTFGIATLYQGDR